MLCDRLFSMGLRISFLRGDLADRAVGLTLTVIPEDQRRDEETFWAEFNSAAPRFLGRYLMQLRGVEETPRSKARSQTKNGGLRQMGGGM